MYGQDTAKEFPLKEGQSLERHPMDKPLSQKQFYIEEFNEYLDKEKHLALMFDERVRKYGDKKIAVRHKPYGTWEAYTWAQFGEMIENTAKAMLQFGTKPKDMVGIFSQNRVEFTVADLAAHSIGATSVPIYATNSAREAEYIINDAEIKILFVGDAEQYRKSSEILTTSKVLKTIIVYDKNLQIGKNASILHFDDFMEIGKKSDRSADLKKLKDSLSSDDLATLIYTSGTTGDPKGVMLTHRNFMAMLFGTGYHQPVGEKDVNLAFLPLSHVFERAWTYFVLSRGAENHYCHDTKKLTEFLKEVKPIYMCSVPRLWEKVHATILEGLNDAPPAKKKIFDWAMKVGGSYNARKRDGKFTGPLLVMEHAVANALVLKKIKGVFGGRNKMFNVGGSAFSAEIAEFFFNAGVLLLQGYGLTECFVISVANDKYNKFGTCGKSVPLMKVRVSAEGEIQAKGPSMMQGYYKKPELTKVIFTDDGWIRTGDVGVIDDEGYITITDRIKDLMKTSGGKYVAPQMIETLLKEDLYIEQAATIGDNRKYVSALIVPAFEALEHYAKKKGIAYSSIEELIRKQAIIDFYRKRIDEQTKDLGQVEKVKKFTILTKELTQENGEITATQKIRRKVIAERYKDIIESMYRD